MTTSPDEVDRLHQAAATGEVDYLAFVRGLRDSRLLLPLAAASGLAPGPHPVGDPAALRLEAAMVDGRPAYLAFSSPERLEAGLGRAAAYAELGAPTVFALLRDGGLLLDHGRPACKHFTPAEMALLLECDFEPTPADLASQPAGPWNPAHALFARPVQG